jgi:hypothetical protein
MSNAGAGLIRRMTADAWLYGRTTSRSPMASNTKVREDDRPLIIDQPEENLDPKSVFDEPVERFREARL